MHYEMYWRQRMKEKIDEKTKFQRFEIINPLVVLVM